MEMSAAEVFVIADQVVAFVSTKLKKRILEREERFGKEASERDLRRRSKGTSFANASSSTRLIIITTSLKVSVGLMVSLSGSGLQLELDEPTTMSSSPVYLWRRMENAASTIVNGVIC